MDRAEYLTEYCANKKCGKDDWCDNCMYLKGKEDGIDIFKWLIVRYIDRAGACNIEDLERLAKIAKEGVKHEQNK